MKRERRLSEAETIFRNVWKTRKEHLRENHNNSLICGERLGVVLRKQKKYTEAEHLYRSLIDTVTLKLSG